MHNLLNRSFCRRMFGLTAILSAALFVCAAIFWARSFTVDDGIILSWWRSYSLRTVPHGFEFEIAWEFDDTSPDGRVQTWEWEPWSDHLKLGVWFSDRYPDSSILK